MLRKAGITTAAYYAIVYVETLFGPVVPHKVRRVPRSNALRRRLHEDRWPCRRITAVETDVASLLWALARGETQRPRRFSACAPPHQIAAHLLLTGHMWPKLRCLGRRLLSREEWLRYHGPQQVELYHLRLLLARAAAASEHEP